MLAIAAARLGFAPVVAVELDEAAAYIARANAAANGVAVDVAVGDVTRDAPWAPTVVANLTLPLLDSLTIPRPPERLIASGFLAGQTPALGMVERERRELDGWAALVLEPRVIRLAVRVERAHAELVLAELMALVPGGLEEREVDGVDRVRALRRRGRAARAGRGPSRGRRRARGRQHQRAARRLGPRTGAASTSPIDVGALRIRPPWEPPREGALDVVIDPGQAFGTGSHATTRLTLELLAELTPDGALADWGCGSGVLAIAAAKLGWAPVLACDLDPESVEAARAGAAANGVTVEVTRCDVRQGGPHAPTVLANLVRPLLLEVAANLTRVPDRLIISGLEGDEPDEVVPAFARHGLHEVARRQGGGWSAIQLRVPRLSTAVITLDDVQAAAGRLAGVAHRTPVITGRSLDEATGAARVLLKAENLQRVGAFKFRGAYNAVASMAPAERARGVATVSSGNHAQALSLAARLHEVPAVILMPDDAPPGKLAATRGYGAEIVLFDRYGQDREALLAALVEERGLVPVHPYDDERVMAGQGTAALELLEDGGPLDILLVAVGGGGLLAGCATAVAGLSPRDARDRRGARGGRRLPALARGGRAGADRGPAHDRRRPAAPDARRAHVPGHPAARRGGGHGVRRRDRRRHALPVRAREDRRRAERRVRVRRAARGQGRRRRAARRRDDHRRQRHRREVRGARGVRPRGVAGGLAP